MLYESPFTDLTPRGPDGIFDGEQVDELVRVLEAEKMRRLIGTSRHSRARAPNVDEQ